MWARLLVVLQGGVCVRVSVPDAQPEQEHSRGVEATVVLGSEVAQGASTPKHRAPAARVGPALLAGIGCASSKHTDYTVCPFANVTQVDANAETHVLGIWERWLSEDEMLYSDGDRCPDGQARNTTVLVRCDASNLAVIDVEEPEVCSYRAVLDVPITCDLYAISTDTQWLWPAPVEESPEVAVVAHLERELEAARQERDA